MIYNLPLMLNERKKEKRNAGMLVLPGIHVMPFYLTVGNAKQYSHLSKPDMLTVTVNELSVVKKVLKDRLEMKVLPQYIIFNLEEQQSLLQSFVQHMRSKPALGKIPLFIYVEKMNDELKEQLVKTGFIDGIITPETTMEEFQQKISFIQKIKSLIPYKKTSRLGIFSKGNSGLNYILKRAFDIAVSGTLLLLASPVMAVIALIIRLESKGSIFYVSPRAGKMYQVFKFYKFRTMVADADKQVDQLTHLNQYDVADTAGPVFFKLSNDPRVTKFGTFLRNTSLDELPQLFNVLKGDMSLVGNRPLPLYEANTLTTDEYAQRFIAPAGITGLWQVKKRGKKDMSVNERIGLDIDYARKHSFIYDMRILASTPAALVQKENV
ncbi:sugar transferase [Chitinophaga nivalis]|uniref:Sugar transferase n=1 Tax=Chitinophaga nivalis TaxID=2991709 RepID=A0ABT3ILP7_9BACT|nr:sugar transferase [Chitinophaga nivalis]MCW3465417.1 sugar transferase [Chitinophaga nivalis]MCW3484891.1 sugar transferase [Chitinophaga nivalis]